MHPHEFDRYATRHLGINPNTLADYQTHVNRSVYGGVPAVTGLTPAIIEERQMNVISMDVFSRLMMDRIIWLGTAIDDYVANIVMAQLLFLESADSNRDINIYVNSPGGSVYAGLGIYDVMQYVKPDVNTVCTGLAASMGALLLAAGKTGKRSALPHSRIMIHQPSSGVQGQVTDMEIVLEQVSKLKKELHNILAFHTGQEYDRVFQDAERDKWMSSEEAKDYGLVDEVLKVTPTGPAPKASAPPAEKSAKKNG